MNLESKAKLGEAPKTKAFVVLLFAFALVPLPTSVFFGFVTLVLLFINVFPSSIVFQHLSWFYFFAPLLISVFLSFLI
jgi:hypothetical protein